MPKRKSMGTEADKSGGNSSKGPRTYAPWSKKDEELLICWLEVPNNFAMWKHSKVSKDGSDTSVNTSGKSQRVIMTEVQVFLRANGATIDRKWETIRGKLKHLEGTWKKANAIVKGTGGGVTEEDGDITLEEKILRICPYWERLNELESGRPGMNPPALLDNTSEPPTLSELMTGFPTAMEEDYDRDQRSLADERLTELMQDAQSESLPLRMVGGATETGRESTLEGDQEKDDEIRVVENVSQPARTKAQKLWKMSTPAKEGESRGTDSNRRNEIAGKAKKPDVTELLSKMIEQKEGQSANRYALLDKTLDIERRQVDVGAEEVQVRLIEDQNKRMMLELQLAKLGKKG